MKNAAASAVGTSIEQFPSASAVIGALMDQGLTQANCGDLEKHAYSVNDGIADGNLRNLHILAGV